MVIPGQEARIYDEEELSFALTSVNLASTRRVSTLGSRMARVPPAQDERRPRSVLTVMRTLGNDHCNAEVIKANPAPQQVIHRLQRRAEVRGGLTRGRAAPSSAPAGAQGGPEERGGPGPRPAAGESRRGPAAPCLPPARRAPRRAEGLPCRRGSA